MNTELLNKVKKAKTKLNKKLLKQIQRRILEEPERFDMNYFCNSNSLCETTLCIAGWALVLSGVTEKEVGIMADSAVTKQAADLLGLEATPGASFYHPLFYRSD